MSINQNKIIETIDFACSLTRNIIETNLMFTLISKFLIREDKENTCGFKFDKSYPNMENGDEWKPCATSTFQHPNIWLRD